MPEPLTGLLTPIAFTFDDEPKQGNGAGNTSWRLAELQPSAGSHPTAAACRLKPAQQPGMCFMMAIVNASCCSA